MVMIEEVPEVRRSVLSQARKVRFVEGLEKELGRLLGKTNLDLKQTMQLLEPTDPKRWMTVKGWGPLYDGAPLG